jgi:hypothetical protein
MKRPLFIFSIYLMIFMSVAALTSTINRDGNIDTTTVAQANGVQIAESE